MHQPLQPIIDQTSTSNDTTGGILSANPADSFPRCQQSNTMQFDDMVNLPYFSFKKDISSSNAYNDTLFSYDPFATLWAVDSAEFNNTSRPMPLVAVDSCKFYDFDLKLTFVALKHERGRGLLQFTWFPGIYDSALLPSEIINARNQKWIWDIETNEQFSIHLTGVKHALWRSKDAPGAIPTGTFDGYTLMNDTRFADDLRRGGYLNCNIISPYNAGNVGPTTCTILCFYELENLRTCEYRPTYTGISGMTQSLWGTV